MFVGIGIGIPLGGGLGQVVTPASISGLLAWYESDSGVTQGGGTVSQWNDKSGNGANLIQGTVGNQPAYTASSFNGFPAISFLNGGTKSLIAADTFPGGVAQPFSIFAVFKVTGANTNFAAALCMGSVGAGFDTAVVGLNNTSNLWPGGAGYGGGEPETVSIGSVYNYGQTYDGANHTQTYLNAALKSTLLLGFNITLNAPTALLCGQYFAGSFNNPIDVLAAAAYSRKLAPGEAQQVQAYFKAKYGL